MFHNLKKSLTSSSEIQNLAGNIVSLSILQGANYILPLLTIPYLVRVLGPDLFGLLAFSTATIGYFILLTDYVFNLSATQQISIHRGNKKKVVEIFSSVMMIKAALMVLSFIFLVILVFSTEKLYQNWQVYFVTFGVLIGQVLFPVWFFQGMERMRFISALNVGVKVLFTVCIFIFVDGRGDYLLVPAFTSLGFILAGLWALYYMKREFAVSFAWQGKAVIQYQLYEGWYVFVSSMAISLYTISTTFILGLFASNTVVGYFAAGDKIVQAVKGIYVPVSQSIYPLIGKRVSENKQAGIKFIFTATKVISVVMFLLSAVLFSLADSVVSLLLGAQYQESILLLKVMAFIPFLVALSNIFGIQAMLNLGYKKEFTQFVVSGALLGVVLLLSLAPSHGALGVSIAVLVVEFLITLILGSFICVKYLKGTL